MLLVTGGTGFVGSYVLEALDTKVPRGQVRLFARNRADLEKMKAHGYDTAVGSVADIDSLRAAMKGVDAVIHLVAIIREEKSRGQTYDRVIGEGTENVALAAQEAGVKRLIFMSALGATNMSTDYFRAKMRGERAVKATGIPYTIFRPSIQIGPGGEFTALLKQLTMLPVVPVPGPGNYPMQPMYVRDMARYFVQSLDDERYVNQTFEVGGPETFEFNDMLRQTMEARHRKGLLFHGPLFLIRPAVPVIEKVMPKLVNQAQFTMLLEGSATKDRRLHEIGGFELTPFRKAIEIALRTRPPSTYGKSHAKPATA